jgi:hypothetical protein
MREASAAAWREFLARHERIHVYTVDPGAHALATEFVPLIRDMGRLGGWFAEGWAAAREPSCRSASELTSSVAPQDAVILGSQTCFERTQDFLRRLADVATTIFTFDHWKNYAQHFGDGAPADAITVPDETGRRLLLEALGMAIEARVHVLPHLGIEAAVDRIRAFGLDVQPGTVALLLDPTEPEDRLGYDWRSVLAAVAEHVSGNLSMRILVKPHPRQDIHAVARELETWQRRGIPFEMNAGDIERLIAMAEGVWGMTTIALNVALAAGKPILSFQIGRNAKGASASNPHIEPFAVV